MHRIYADGEWIEECMSRTIGGSTFVVDKPSDIEALQALCLECESLEAFREWMPRYEKWLQWFSANESEYTHRVNATNELSAHPDNLSEVRQFGDALRIAKEIWQASGDDVGNLRVLAAVNSGHTALNYEAELPALLLYQGSLLAEFIPFIPHVGFAMRAGKFLVGIGLKAGAVAPVIADQMVEDLRARVRIASKNHPDLKRLDRLGKEEVKGKKGVIVLLHGLASTDVCTFDGFLDAWREPEGRYYKDRTFRETVDTDFLEVGWPHNTLTSITANAQTLLKYIDEKIGQDGPPIVFVCHSRGGLLARKVAVMMQEQQGQWADKVKLCVTFGTPHLGAALAANEYRFMGAFASVTSTDQKVLSIYRLLSYYAKEKAFEGIDELRPADVRSTDPQGNFLRELVEQERLAGKPALLKLNILPIGGIYRGSKKHVFRLVTKMLGTTDHDLVVEKKSSVPQFFPAGESVTCSHFEYFSPSQESSDQFRRAVAAVRQALGFEQAQIERMLALSSDLDVNKPLTFKDKAKGSTGG